MAGGGDALGVGIAAGAGINLAAFLGTGGCSDLGGIAVAGGGNALGVGITAGAGIYLAAFLGTGGCGFNTGVLVAQSLQDFHSLLAAGAGLGNGTVRGAGSCHGHGGELVLMGILIGLLKDNQPVAHGADFGGREGLELAAVIAGGIIVAGRGTANCQHLAAILGFQAPAAIGTHRGICGDILAGAAGSRACGTQILAVLCILQRELAALCGCSPCQSGIIADNVRTGAVGLHRHGNRRGIAANGIGIHTGSIIAVVHQDILLTGGNGGSLAPDLAGFFRNSLFGNGLFGDSFLGNGLFGDSFLGNGLFGDGHFGDSFLGNGGFGNLGQNNRGVITGNGNIQGIVAGVNAAAVIGGITDGIRIDQHGNRSADTGGGAVGSGGLGFQITRTDVGKIQNHRLGIAAAVRADGHGAALGVIIVACLVISMVVAEEECHVHIQCNSIDGRCPLVSMAVVVTVVQQGLMGSDQQRTVLVHFGSICLEIGNGGFHRRGKAIGCTVAQEACTVTVVGGSICHAQHIDVVVAVICSAQDAVGACAVCHVAGLIDGGGAIFLDRIAVMVGPDKVDINGGIVQTAGAADGIGQGGSVAGVLVETGVAGIVVDGKCVAAAGDGSVGDTRLLQSAHQRVQHIRLVVAFIAVQIAEQNSRIHDSAGGCLGIHGHHREDQNKRQQSRKESLQIGSHCISSFFIFWGLLRWLRG